MLALFPIISARLQSIAALTGWDLRLATQVDERSALPACHVGIPGAGVGKGSATAVQLEPRIVLLLVVGREAPDFAESLDAALGAVVESLHNWMPGQAGGRRWEPLKLQAITEPDFVAGGLVGYQLTFTTSGLYRGQS